jgi:hypothetical protein
VRLDDGIVATHWLTRPQLLARLDDLRSPMVLRCVDDYLAGTRLALDTITHLGVGDGDGATDAVTSAAGSPHTAPAAVERRASR